LEVSPVTFTVKAPLVAVVLTVFPLVPGFMLVPYATPAALIGAPPFDSMVAPSVAPVVKIEEEIDVSIMGGPQVFTVVVFELALTPPAFTARTL
jgi:hypothetical protein